MLVSNDTVVGGIHMMCRGREFMPWYFYGQHGVVAFSISTHHVVVGFSVLASFQIFFLGH